MHIVQGRTYSGLTLKGEIYGIFVWRQKQALPILQMEFFFYFF